MEHYILVIDYDSSDLEVAHREWNKHNILLRVVHTIPGAIRELLERNFLFIAVFSKRNDFFSQLEILRQIRPTSILIFPPNHDIPNRTIDFFNSINGIESYFETEPERGLFLDNGKHFFGYYAEQSDNKIPPVRIHVHKDIFLIVDYRKVFVNGQEIELARADFDMLELLMSQTGRVFTYEQIYNHAYGNDTPIKSMKNSVHCHIKRIRQKIRPDKSLPQYIDSVRSIGYRILFLGCLLASICFCLLEVTWV